MSRSLGEVASLAVKAVRGAGQPWGVAEEAGWAIRWLGRAGLPGPAALARALEAGDLSALLTGIAVADLGAVPDPVGPVGEPLMLVPFVARLVPPGEAFLFEARDRAFRIWQTGAEEPTGATWRLTGSTAAPDPMPGVHTRVPDAPDVLVVLERFAHRTYAPATEQSRLSGAGAGLVDND